MVSRRNGMCAGYTPGGWDRFIGFPTLRDIRPSYFGKSCKVKPSETPHSRSDLIAEAKQESHGSRICNRALSIAAHLNC